METRLYHNLKVTRGGHEFRHESTGTRARGTKARVLDMLDPTQSSIDRDLSKALGLIPGGHFNFVCTGVCGHRIGNLTPIRRLKLANQ